MKIRFEKMLCLPKNNFKNNNVKNMIRYFEASNGYQVICNIDNYHIICLSANKKFNLSLMLVLNRQSHL